MRRAAAHIRSPASLHLAVVSRLPYQEQYQELRSLASCSCSILSSSPSECWTGSTVVVGAGGCRHGAGAGAQA